MVLRILSDTHVVIVAQDAATYKVMDLFDARCMYLAKGEKLVLISIFLTATSVMDVDPMVIQLVDGLEFPVLPRNPSANDPLSVWYIKVLEDSS
jgi:hypothetical protein